METKEINHRSTLILFQLEYTAVTALTKNQLSPRQFKKSWSTVRYGICDE